MLCKAELLPILFSARCASSVRRGKHRWLGSPGGEAVDAIDGSTPLTRVTPNHAFAARQHHTLVYSSRNRSALLASHAPAAAAFAAGFCFISSAHAPQAAVSTLPEHLRLELRLARSHTHLAGAPPLLGCNERCARSRMWTRYHDDDDELLTRTAPPTATSCCRLNDAQRDSLRPSGFE